MVIKITINYDPFTLPNDIKRKITMNIILTNLTRILISSCFITPAFAATKQSIEEEYASLVTAQFRDLFEEKNIDNIGNYISSTIQFYRNAEAPWDFDTLQEHVIRQNEMCVHLKMLPFDDLLVSNNKVVARYTWNCIDQSGKLNQKKIISIFEFNDQKLVQNIWQVASS